ncbi:MAG: Gldg family protein [Phycisphaerales bacterium]
MKATVVFAIFKRNFVSYFSSPIGYVFICAFVLLSAFATFWPNEFFNANLANLDQLNSRLPWIMLVFVPAVTMATWAQERERGTDELLLTLPAGDFDVVAGKYLSALAIFTVSLIFSLSNIIVLIGLGEPDMGLLAANYLGYWLVGAAMLSVGMVASFLTSNLTVSFILAMAFNTPLVFAAYADALIPQREAALAVRSFGVAEQFSDLGRGVATISALAFFGSIVIVMLYLSMVLIRRRHWVSRRAGIPMASHFLVRAVSLLAIAVGATALANRFDLRLDLTSEKLSSLSAQTRALLENLSSEQPVFIEAYISPEVPQRYVKIRLDLLAKLREVDSLGGDNVVVRINTTRRFSSEAQEAQEQFGINARPVQSIVGGKLSQEDIYLGAAFMCGLDRVVVPFFDRGIPVEYETVRSIATVSQQSRKRLGILTTDARLYGGLDFQTMSSRPNQPIVSELNKQYETVRINPADPIPDDLDALLVVQPSSLPAAQLDNFLDAVRRGIPTAIFEDPFPVRDGAVAPTSQPRIAPGGNNPFMNQQPPPPKGNIQLLWDLLQVDFSDRQIVRDDYNPYPNLGDLPPEYVFIGIGSGAPEPFSRQSASTNGLQEMMLLFPGSIRPRPGATTQITPLLLTGDQAGFVSFDDIRQRTILGFGGLNPNRRVILTQQPFTLAAHIRGSAASADRAPTTRGEQDDEEAAPAAEFNVVLTGDIDLLYSIFFNLRAQGTDPDAPVNLELDNVTFVLNVLDELAGDDRFIEIRKRRRVHRSLTAVEKRTEQARQITNQQREQFIAQFDQRQADERRKLDEEIEKLQQRPDIDIQQMALEVQAKMQARNKRMQAATERLARERDDAIERIERDLTLEIRRVQDRYKLAAVTLPPIPPLLVGALVFARRRRIENVGTPQQRMRGGETSSLGGSA